MKITKLTAAIRLFAILLGLSSGGLATHVQAEDQKAPAATEVKSEAKSESEGAKSEAKKSEKDDDDKDEKHEDKNGADDDKD